MTQKLILFSFTNIFSVRFWKSFSLEANISEKVSSFQAEFEAIRQ